MNTPLDIAIKPDERKDANSAHTVGEANGLQVNGSTGGNTNAATNGQTNGDSKANTDAAANGQTNGAAANGQTKGAAANGQTNGDSKAEGTYPKPLGSYPPTGIDVLIIGTGLAGLTCAIECTRKGHTVRVLERNSTINTAGICAPSLVHATLIAHKAKQVTCTLWV